MNKRFFLFGLLLYSCTIVAQTSISRAEYWIDNDPGCGEATALPITNNGVSSAIPTSSLSEGWHTLGLRAKGGNNNWSNTCTQLFFVPNAASSLIGQLTGLEYFIDSDPGHGQATAIPFTPGQKEFALALQEMDTLPPGLHMIGLRARRGPVWTETYTRTFLNAALYPQMEVTAVEAFWDNDTTTAIPLPFTREEGYYLVSGALINTGELALGSHILCIRATADGRQSVMQCFEVIISKDDPTGLTNTTNALPGAYKILRGNRVYIICPLNEKDRKIYTVTGTEVQ